MPGLGPGLWCSVPLEPADEDEGGHHLQPWSMVGTAPGGRQGEMGQKQRKSSTNPSWFFAVVSLALAHSLHGYEGQRHRKRGALAWRALDVDGPMVGHNDFAHDIEPQACPFRTCTV